MSAMLEAAPAEVAASSYTPYQVSVREYVTFREQGFLVVRGLVAPEEVRELTDHMDNLLAGRETIPGVAAPSFTAPGERLQYWLRVHMLHRRLALHERFLLHPRVLDVLEALIGPDVLALQSMLFFKQPGQPGQGYHQDLYYIPTFPDTLCGAWLAIDRADEQNGCMWITVGSQHEPVYPDTQGTGHGHHGLGDLEPIDNASHTDESCQRADAGGARVRRPRGQGRGRPRRCGVLRRPYSAPLAQQPLGSLTARVCGPLLQRALVGALEPRPAVRGRGGQRPAHPGARHNPPALRPAAVRHALRRQPARRIAPRRASLNR